MSATFRQVDYDRVVSLFGNRNTIVMEGPLSRRNTTFKCIVSGAPSSSLLQSATAHLKHAPDKQQLWYCNSRTTCEGSLRKKADLLLEKYVRSTGQQACCSSFTGGDGLKIKTSIMDAFTSFAELQGDPILHDDGTVTLAKIYILLATSAANSRAAREVGNVAENAPEIDLADNC